MMGTRTIYALLLLALPGGHGLCPGKNGTEVDWWIIYQQRSMPFFHFYVDSTSNSDVSYHRPEAPDSALSRAVTLVTDGTLPQYFLYSYDLINIMDVSNSMPYPTHSKWMQGLLASDGGTKKGFWILHNNFLFPAMKDGEVLSPDSYSWRAVTIGSSSEDLFYICLSLEDRESLLDAVKSILAGNPFVYHKRLGDLDLENYFTEIKGRNHPFSSVASANIFMECLTATDEAKRHRCMYEFQTKNVDPIQVYTRPRGMLQGGKRFCYNQQSSSLFEFVGVSGSNPTNSISSSNMFAISDDVKSQQYGVVCFGQDVAANSDTVAVMICSKLPGLWRSMVQSSMLTNWGCPIRGFESKPDKQREHLHLSGPQHHGIPSPLSQSVSSQTSVPEVRRLRRDVTSISDQERQPKESKAEIKEYRRQPEKNEHKREHKRSKREAPEAFDHPKKKEVDFKQSQNGLEKFLRYENREDAGEDRSNAKLERYMEIKMPFEKPSREKEPPKTLVKVVTSDEFERFVLSNRKQLLAIFCRKGCRYCASAEPEFHMLINHFLKEDVEFYHVDVGEVEMPYQLEVSWTPYVRFKPRGVTELFPYQWKDFDGEAYDFRSLYKFLDEHVERLEKNQNSRGNSDGDAQAYYP